jgi:hypothetical protein
VEASLWAGRLHRSREDEKAAWRKKFASISPRSADDRCPALALGCFAGVRPDESARMKWEMIDFDRKHIDCWPNHEATASVGLWICPRQPDRMVISLPQAVRKDPTSRTSGESALGAVPGDELERRLAGGHFETLYGSYHLAIPQCCPYGRLGTRMLMLYAHYREW